MPSQGFPESEDGAMKGRMTPREVVEVIQACRLESRHACERALIADLEEDVSYWALSAFRIGTGAFKLETAFDRGIL